MFALLILPSAALAWRPAPGIPLERQMPANRQYRQFTDTGSGSGSGCDFDPWTQECNATEIWCDSGYYNDYTCWYGNYCVQQINEWDGCPGMCHMPCNWETEDYCDMGYDSNNCWLGNYCMNRESGGCPTMPGSGSMDSGSTDYGTSSGSGFSCFEPYEQACNATEIHCDAGMDSEGCWYGNYCINQVNEWDGCYGVCSMNCNWETEDWCDMGTDSNGCWMGNWCQDKSMGGCPAPMGGSEVASGEDICAHMTWTEECGASQISCDSGYSYEGCWFGNYCIDSVNSWDSCPGVCSNMCNWDTEEWCDMGVDTNGCWMGNWCQDINMGGCPDVNMVSKRGFMEKQKAMAHRADFGSGSADYSGFDYGSDYGFDYSGFDYGSGSGRADFGSGSADYSGSDFWSNYGSDYGSDYGFDYGSGSD